MTAESLKVAGTSLVEKRKARVMRARKERRKREQLPALGVNAQALNYLNFLIAEPIKAAAIYRSGVLVQVPRPERYAIHKLIIADRRCDGASSLKASKDREQRHF